MKLFIFCVALAYMATGCTAWHDGYSYSPDSKKKDKRIIYPPQSFVDAIFNYKKKNIFWPDQLESSFTSHQSYQEYKTFVDKGVESMRISKSTRDTLLIDFVYSHRKNNAYYSRPDNSLPAKTIYGQYEFVQDSNYTFFRVVLRKQKFFSVSFK